MSNYQLAYERADGDVVKMPARINADADIDELRAFAKECGYDPSGWEDNHDSVLNHVFEKATLLPQDLPKGANPTEHIDLSPFLRALRKEDGLFQLPDEEFKKRLEAGVLNTIVDGNGRLIGTMNVIPKFTPSIKGRLGLNPDKYKPQIFETGAGWTAERYRGLGLYTKFRASALNEANVSNRLIFSQANGKGASSVNAKDGWTLFNPREFPFVTALLGWPEGAGWVGRTYQLGSGLSIKLPEGGVYAGKPIHFSRDNDGSLSERAKLFFTNHDWDNHFHIWTNNYEKLVKCEHNIRVGLGIGDDAPREAFVNTYNNVWLPTIRDQFLIENVSQDNARGQTGWEAFDADGTARPA